MAARELMFRLRGVRRVRFGAVALRPGDWNGIGTGTVVVGESGSDSISLTESGTWRPTAGAETKFGNLFACSPDGG